MSNPYKSLQIGGKRYEGDELLAIAVRQCENMQLPAWEREIYLFIASWLSAADHIEVPTSGSTGMPKMIRLKKEWMINSARITVSRFSLDGSSSALLCLPAGYIAGKMMLTRAFVSGCNLIIAEPVSDPFKGLSGVIDFAAVTPHQLYSSLGTLKAGKSVGTLIVGGGGISAALEESAGDTGTDVFATYGMTETCSHIALRKINPPGSSSWFSVLEGISISTDHRSCLVIDAPHLAGSTLVTNDFVELRDERHFRWIGRIDNVINSGGLKIFPEQLERVFSDLRSERIVVVAMPDEKFGNIPVLVIESETIGADQKNRLLEQIAGMTGKYQVPKKVVTLPSFPETPTGKPDREKISGLLRGL